MSHQAAAAFGRGRDQLFDAEHLRAVGVYLLAADQVAFSTLAVVDEGVVPIRQQPPPARFVPHEAAGADAAVLGIEGGQ